MQRSISLLFQGEFQQAFFMYPAIYPIIVLLLFLGCNTFIKFKHEFIIKTSLIVVCVLTIIIGYMIKMKFIFN
ncbi:DUF2752 domain-containing protein [Aquimarina sp. U1-2]|uniref:DUF2752 domain-containing protein n=1 Tax=Aquimarina sp. U1-2 TaxID=2823141 RepID=UPI0035300981